MDDQLPPLTAFLKKRRAESSMIPDEHGVNIIVPGTHAFATPEQKQRLIRTVKRRMVQGTQNWPTGP